jgi:predicted transglutaminase-like cysteine proteinase
MMMMTRSVLAVALSLAGVCAFAQTTAASTTQRDVNQQTRIENGLKDGSLNTKEAAKLEREESHVDRLQAKDLKDGKLSAAERAQLNAAQNKVSTDIAADKHNAATGNPDSASSKRMQADVARNVNQEKRIEGGIQNGSLTNHEAAKLERGQAHVDRKEAAAGADGHVGKAEQRRIQRSENRQSGRIHREKHDAQVRG